MQSDSSANAGAAPAGSGARLLVVDDDLVQRTIISRIGAQVGYEVRAAASVDEAARALRAGTFDCVTLDLSLGEQSGTNLLRAIADAGHPAVIVISGCEERVLNSAVRLANMLGLPSCQLPKPLDLSELRASLQANWPNQPRASETSAPPPAFGGADIEAALDRGEIVPFFQPRVELVDGRVTGCEATPHWRHPTAGVLRPDVFLPMAEAAGLSARISGHMLRASCFAARELAAANGGFSVAVNLSALLPGDGDLQQRIDRALADSGMPARGLTVEVGEAAVGGNLAGATESLVGLRVLGVGVALQDFGAGPSSLAVLARIPFSEMKIDRAFSRACLSDPDMARVVRACARLGHELDMQIVAEGVESSEGANCVRELGCDVGQGDFYAAALDPVAMTGWLAAWEQRREPAGLSVYTPSRGPRRRGA